MSKDRYKFKARLWIYPGELASWHFITVPKKESAQITDTFRAFKRGWGSLPVDVSIRKTNWKTSVFPDSKSGTYMLPVKALIRRKEGLEAGDQVTVEITIKP